MVPNCVYFSSTKVIEVKKQGLVTQVLPKKNHFNNEIIMKGNITGALLTPVSVRLMCMMTITRVMVREGRRSW